MSDKDNTSQVHPDMAMPSKSAPAAAQGVDTPMFRRLTYTYAEALFKGTVPATQKAWGDLVQFLDTTYGAQQREAGRREGFDNGWDEGHIAGREKGRSRQPAGEGLTSMTRYEPCAAYGGPVMKADAQGEWVSYADVQALSAVPPAKAEWLTDEQIKSEYAQQLKKCYASGRPHEPIADVIVSTVRAILAQQAKGASNV